MEGWLRGVDPTNFDVRVVRTDLRQDGDLAAAWLTTRRVTPSGPTAIEGDWVGHIVLRRIDDAWRILSVSVATPVGRSARRRRPTEWRWWPRPRSCSTTEKRPVSR